MKNKKMFLILILVFVMVLVGASLLYSRLGGEANPGQLAVQNGQPQQSEAPAQSPQPPTNPETTPNPQPSEDPEPSGSAEQPLAPDFTVYDREGNPVELTDYFGKPIVLNFWASWCGPCRAEMPEFHEKYLDLKGEVQFLMVNMTGGRETLESAAEYIDEQGYTFPVFYDLHGDAAITYGAYSLPTTYFIDAEGHAIARAVGAINGETLQRGIDMILPQN